MIAVELLIVVGGLNLAAALGVFGLWLGHCLELAEKQKADALNKALLDAQYVQDAQAPTSRDG